MKFEAKLFKLGNSVAVYIPKDVYSTLKVGEVYTFSVLNGEKVYTKEVKPDVNPVKVYTGERNEEKVQSKWFCHKHDSWNTECGCG